MKPWSAWPSSADWSDFFSASSSVQLGRREGSTHEQHNEISRSHPASDCSDGLSGPARAGVSTGRKHWRSLARAVLRVGVWIPFSWLPADEGTLSRAGLLSRPPETLDRVIRAGIRPASEVIVGIADRRGAWCRRTRWIGHVDWSTVTGAIITDRPAIIAEQIRHQVVERPERAACGMGLLSRERRSDQEDTGDDQTSEHGTRPFTRPVRGE